MIVTPKMWELEQRITHLQWLHQCDPNDYMIEFELDELSRRYARLAQMERLGLKVILGGRHSSNSSTDPNSQAV
jgi:hypothetical protein